MSDIDDSTLALYDPNQETFAERVAALKDIIPPTTRLAIADTFDSVYGWTAWGANKAGSAAWVVTTSALLVGLPLMLSIEGEAALVQQEKEYLGQVSARTPLFSDESRPSCLARPPASRAGPSWAQPRPESDERMR